MLQAPFLYFILDLIGKKKTFLPDKKSMESVERGGGEGCCPEE